MNKSFVRYLLTKMSTSRVRGGRSTSEILPSENLSLVPAMRIFSEMNRDVNSPSLKHTDPSMSQNNRSCACLCHCTCTPHEFTGIASTCCETDADTAINRAQSYCEACTSWTVNKMSSFIYYASLEYVLFMTVGSRDIKC